MAGIVRPRGGAYYWATVYRYLFFFSSRRRHTRCLSDWSSDVCSSDLPPWPSLRRTWKSSTVEPDRSSSGVAAPGALGPVVGFGLLMAAPLCLPLPYSTRSEERRVGKGCKVQGEVDDYRGRCSTRRGEP